MVNARLAALLMALGVASCSSMDRLGATSFEPLRTDGGHSIYRYRAFADAVYPLESSSAEATRLGWLQQWLADNGLDPAQYRILSRQSVARTARVHDIFYDVAVVKRVGK